MIDVCNEIDKNPADPAQVAAKIDEIPSEPYRAILHFIVDRWPNPQAIMKYNVP